MITYKFSVFLYHNGYKFGFAFGMMITYNDIYECLRKEKYSEQLQALPKKFVSEVSVYISEKKKIANAEEDDMSGESLKTKKQLENAISIFNELMLLRKKKILGLVFVASETGISKRDFENMLDFEKELFDEIIESVKKAEKKLSSQFRNGDVIKSENELEMVLFLEEVDEFLDMQGNPLGPFRVGEIVNMPKQIADILLSDKKVEVVSRD